TLNTRFMQGYTWPPGTFSIQDAPPAAEEMSQRYYTGKIARELLGGNAAKFVMWVEQGAYASFYRAGPTLQTSQAAAQRRGWHRKFSWWSAGFADGHALWRYMDTRVVHDPEGTWTMWDPKKPGGGLP